MKNRKAIPKMLAGAVVPVSVALLGALLGMSAAPTPLRAAATAREFSTWKCGPDDSCDAGTRTCCRDPIDNPDYSHCSTAGCEP